MKEAYAAFNRGDIELLLDMFSDDADRVLPSIEDDPEGVPRTGRAQIGELFVALANAEEMHCKVLEEIGAGPPGGADEKSATSRREDHKKAPGSTGATSTSPRQCACAKSVNWAGTLDR